MPAKSLKVTDVGDYREQIVLSLSTTRSLAIKANREAQQRYKLQSEKTAKLAKFSVGDWVLIYFPQDETGKSRKLSHPWHGPYRMISRDDSDITATKIYFLDDPSMQVHQTRVQHCPYSLPSGFYWYGAKRSKPGRPPKKLLKHLVPLVVEAETLSSSGNPIGAGNGDQLAQPGSNNGTSNSTRIVNPALYYQAIIN